MRDRIELLSPPILLEKFARYALAGHKREVVADDPRARDPELVDLLLDLVRALGRLYFRLEVRGDENVPAEGPVLLVGNHNGGLLPTDAFFTSLAVRERFGAGRPVYALAHDFLFYDSTLRRYALRLGALRAGHESARRVFDQGGIVLVYPGSDLDAFRPWRERARVILGGRKGFLRLALAAGVPIVPVVSAGTHEQLIVLTRGDRLAKLLHMHRWARTFVCPIVLSFPWGITSGFVPYLPLPAQTTLAFGPPMTWPDPSAGDAEAPEMLDRCYAEVEARMQSMLDELYDGRRPFLGRRRA
ncbi:MAG TPA: lysophospholipid acyltransferase family protein [Polyangiaceae bacterium]